MMRLFLLSLALSSVTAFAPSMQKAVRTTQGVANPPLFRSNNKVSSTQRSAVLEQTELPEKLYFKQAKEMPKVLGGLKIGLRELVVVTGASSGLGLNCAATLAKTGKYFVVMAVRDIEKGKRGKSRFFFESFFLTRSMPVVTNRASLLFSCLQLPRNKVCPKDPTSA